MVVAARIEHMDSKYRAQLDRLRAELLRQWGAPRLDHTALSRIYAEMLAIVTEAHGENAAARARARPEHTPIALRLFRQTRSLERRSAGDEGPRLADLAL